ncbi:hypothetical protein PN36_11995 [Candidatus Thiomargarita nelsonii]|uniref:Uncharacterized protein n=1 Tax=Candidatus Thiomargarita nelsonii TaxID=1003181 RepID=A0A0A6RMF7_9GAMM|nr:hypothetical protein PN36_11995 [Candidatus Thiomargarita nelsonii]
MRFDSKIGNYRPRRKKKRYWLVLILLLAVGGYFALPSILKSIEQAEQAETIMENEPETGADKQIIKTIPLPELGAS